MFRYIALVWDDAATASSLAARALSMAIEARSRWRVVLRRPGLHVHVADAGDGTNAVHPLPDHRGVVLGRLFRHTDDLPARNALLSQDEADRIVGSGGRSLVHDHWGRYVAFVAGASGAVRIVRDPSGGLPCFVRQHDGVRVVFSWLDDVLAGPLHLPPPSVNWDGVAGQLLYGELGGRETPLDGVTQVLPGEALETDRSSWRGELLWNAVDLARTATEAPRDDPAPHLRHLVRRCARAWAAGHDHILLRLSGGVDSSILLSTLARDATPVEVTCVNHHSSGSDSDERRYARLAAARAGRELVERERDASFDLRSILQVARTVGPVHSIGRMDARADAELAATRGATAVFTGAGGDQLFYEFPRWWPAADYLHSRGPGPGFLAVALDSARLGRVSVWRAIASALAERVRPSAPWRDTHSQLPLVGAQAWGLAGQADRFMHPALHRIADLPIGKATQVLSLVHPVPYYDPFERDAAPEAVNPLLSQPLVEWSLRCPTWILTRGGRGRALARRAFADDLPPEIARRRSKGGMEEHIQAVLRRHIDFARGLLIDGELVRRGLLDRSRVEAALSGRPTALASHTGRLYVYLGIEAWLSRWPAARRGTAP